MINERTDSKMKTSIRKTQRNGSHAAGVLLSLMMLFSVFANVSVSAQEPDGDSWKKDQIPGMGSEAEEPGDSRYVTSETTSWDGGTWIVDGNVTVSERILSMRDVTLRLNEGAVLNAQKGIRVDGALCIEGTGTLNTVGYNEYLGIECGGTLIINGGTITCSGHLFLDSFLPAIYASSGSVTINGGQVTATGVDGHTGIEGSVTLGWTEESDFIETTGIEGTVAFVEGKRFYYADTTEEVTSASFRAGRLLPLLDTAKTVIIEVAENGGVTADKLKAVAGDTVTLTASSPYPYVLDSLTVVTATGAPVDVERIDRTTCRFVMPDEDVVVTPVFAELSPVLLMTSEGEKSCLPVVPNQPSFDSSVSEWYAVAENVIFPERLSVVGNVKLHLCEGTTLTCEKGIRVEAGNGLTIEGEGALVARTDPTASVYDNHAAIGSDEDETCGDITIHSGTITATGDHFATAIGAGDNGNGGSVTITGGKVTAIGGTHSPGIGTSYYNSDVNTAITLGWTEEDDFIECSAYNGSVSFVDGKEFLHADNLEIVTVDNLSGGRIIPKRGDSHSIVLNSTGDGALVASSASAVKDAIITLSWTTTNRYVIPAPLTVKDGHGHEIDVEWTSPSCATFVMPDDDVTVTAAFGDVGHMTVTTSDGVSRDCRPITQFLSFNDYGTGSYAVTEDTTIDDRVVIGGDVLLYLCEGTTLTCGSGITVDGDSSLTVEGGGSLVADARGYGDGRAAGIGGGYHGDNTGTITINGGSVTAYGSTEGAGIGGSSYGSGGTITINGGSINATGGNDGAGIGGGFSCSVGTIAINGGQVTATGGQNGAGIGRGWSGNGGRVTLGWTTANDFIHASRYAADSLSFKENKYFLVQGTGALATIGDIGGNTIIPFTGRTYAITENPGTYSSIDAVYADGTDSARRTTEAPEGITVHVRCRILDEYYYEREIDGLAVTGPGGVDVAVTALGGGVFSFAMPAGDVTLTPQVSEIVYYTVILWRDGRGEFTSIQRDFNDSEPREVTYSTESSLGWGTFAREGDIVHLRVRCIPPYYPTGISVTTENGETVAVTKHSDLAYEFVMPGDAVTATIQTAEIETVVKSTSEGEQACLALRIGIHDWPAYSQAKDLYWYATTEDTTIPHTVYVESNLHARLYLAEGTTLVCPGIFVEAGSSLAIEGEGTLIADASGAVSNEDFYAGMYRAGIGGGGNIIIKGGNITAKGGFEGAGIGGDLPHDGYGTGGYSGDVTISGGTVTAIGNYAAGIGSSFRENCGVITISGGTVTAFGGAWGAGIGGGYAANGDIRISGGFVNATGGGEAAGIGGGFQGTGGKIAISGGVVSAQGGGGDGCGAGIGEGSYAVIGEPTIIRITGGQITARGDRQPGGVVGGGAELYYSAGIGLGWLSQVGVCDITLGWTEESDYVDSDLYYGTVTFADGKFFKLSGTDTQATPDNINGVRIVPALQGFVALLQGQGTEDTPWLIRSERDWKVLCDSLLGGDETSGKFFRQTADISVTNMLGAPGHSFAGVFDGDGHTLTVELTDNVNECVAPFSLIDGATIANLAVTGIVSSTKNHAAGLVGGCGTNAPNVIRGCVVEANVAGGGYQGGIVGHGGQGELTLEGCVFGGSVSGFTAVAGGLMGWCNSMKLHLDNCLVKGTFTPGNGGRYHPLACKRANQTVPATVSGAYYLNTLASTVIDGFSVPGAEGIPVSATYVDGEWTRPVTAADGLTYYRQASSSYAEWAAETGITGAWYEKDADGIANVFRYVFDVAEGTDGLRILDVTFDEQGRAVVQTPRVANSVGFDLSIATADDPGGGQNAASYPLDTDGETVIDEPETGSRSRFYRLKARPE